MKVTKHEDGTFSITELQLTELSNISGALLGERLTFEAVQDTQGKLGNPVGHLESPIETLRRMRQQIEAVLNPEPRGADGVDDTGP